LENGNNIATDKHIQTIEGLFGYLQIEYFKNATYALDTFVIIVYILLEIAIVQSWEDSGPDVGGEESGIIAPSWYSHFVGS
jgi:hypothetical protein